MENLKELKHLLPISCLVYEKNKAHPVLNTLVVEKRIKITEFNTNVATINSFYKYSQRILKIDADY
ncbi:MAG: hypothetical protein WC716_14185 [Chitinophagaceae bacterium]|jgi:hypothetical protein